MRRPLRSGVGSRGFLSAGTAAVLVVSSLAMVAGSGFRFGETRLRDGVTWMFDRKQGEAVQVNGSSGKVALRIALPGSKGKDLEMVQRDNNVWAVDKATGQAASLDLNGLKVKARTSFGTKDDIDPVLGDRSGYLVNRTDGSIQRVDPLALEALGDPLPAGKGLSQGVADDAGRLWVARNATGEILRIDPDGADGLTEGVRRKLAGPGSQLEITLTDDGIVVTDAKTGKQWRLDGDGKEIGSYQAEVPVAPSPDDRVTPEVSTGPYVPITTGGDDASVVPPPTEPGGGGAPVPSIPMQDLPGPDRGYDSTDPAVTLGDRIYVPVPDESVLIVLDRTGHHLDTIAVPGEGGFQLILDDGRLWANDPDDPEALRIDVDGTVSTVEKSAEDVPATPPKETPKPPKDPDKGPKPPTGGGGTGTTTTTTAPPVTTTTIAPPVTTTTTAPPPTTQTPTTVKDPDPPGAVVGLAAAGADQKISLTWRPGDTGGAPITGNTVSWQPTVAGCGQAGKVAKGALTAVDLRGLQNECAYRFTVVPANRVGTSRATPASVVATPSAKQPATPAAPTAQVDHATGTTTIAWAKPDMKGQTPASYKLVATTDTGPVELGPLDPGQTSLPVPASAGGGPGTLVLGKTYTFSVSVATTKGTASDPSPPSGAVEVYAGAAGIQITNQVRQSAQVWQVTVQATWQGKVGTIQAAGTGGADGAKPGDGPVTFNVQVPWGQTANFSFQANVDGAPPAQANGNQPNPLPAFTGGPDPVWGACSNNPDIAGDKVHENGYWQIGIDGGGQGGIDYVTDVQSTWAYAYGTNQPSPTQANEGFGTPPTSLNGSTIRTNGRRHEDLYTFFVQFRFKVKGYDGWITSGRAAKNSPDCAGD